MVLTLDNQNTKIQPRDSSPKRVAVLFPSVVMSSGVSYCEIYFPGHNRRAAKQRCCRVEQGTSERVPNRTSFPKTHNTKGRCLSCGFEENQPNNSSTAMKTTKRNWTTSYLYNYKQENMESCTKSRMDRISGKGARATRKRNYTYCIPLQLSIAQAQ